MGLDCTPTGWRRSPLGKCCEIVAGGTPSRERPEFWGGTIPWVTPKDISGLDDPLFMDPPEHISEIGLRNSSAAILPAGAILLSSRAPIGLVAIAGRPMATNQGFKNLVPGPDLDSRFLYHAIKRIVPLIAARGNGATFKEVSKSVMEEIELSYPPTVTEQKRIAAILDKADAIRRKRRQALAEIDALLRATFLDMFGDLARNPRNYPLKSIAELVDPERPVTYGILMPGPDVEDGVPYIRVTDIQGGRVLVAQVRRTTNKIADEYRRSRLQPGDLLLSIRGHVGRMAFTPDELDGANITQDTARLAIQNKVDAIYLRASLESPGFQHLMSQRTKGGAVKGINLGDVKALKIPMAPEKARKAFAEAWLHMQAMIDRGRQSLHEAEQLFSSLSQRAFRGEL